MMLPPTMQLLLLVVFAEAVRAWGASHEHALPSYHYGAPIRVECMNRSS